MGGVGVGIRGGKSRRGAVVSRGIAVRRRRGMGGVRGG